MSSETQQSGVSHLCCQACGDRPTVARFDSEAKIVCHCTHVDGDVEPVELDEMAELPDRWAFVENLRGVEV